MINYTLDDILLTPQYSEVESRSQVDLSMFLGNGVTLAVPIISSPMDTVTGGVMAGRIGALGGLGIIHRYLSIKEQVAHIEIAKEYKPKYIGAAIGTTGDFRERAHELVKAGVRVICVDVAHGHHMSMKRALYVLRTELDNRVHIMAGNVATHEGFRDLESWGADSIRCGIGGGSACSTRIQTGHGVTNLETLEKAKLAKNKAGIIIDGGIKSAGDMVKSFALGADAIMVGSLLAATDASPGLVVDGRKTYRGMASKEAQMDWRGKAAAAEGVIGSVKFVGVLEDYLGEITGNIRSGCSYSGVFNLKDLHSKARYEIISHASQYESKPHILTRD